MSLMSNDSLDVFIFSLITRFPIVCVIVAVLCWSINGAQISFEAASVPTSWISKERQLLIQTEGFRRWRALYRNCLFLTYLSYNIYIAYFIVITRTQIYIFHVSYLKMSEFTWQSNITWYPKVLHPKNDNI